MTRHSNLKVESMDITIENILTTIVNINQRKLANFVVKPQNGITPNYPIGVDSLALILNVKVDEIEPIIKEMISFDILEMVNGRSTIPGGRKGWDKVRLKE
jgi:hypothetical protein